MASQSTAPSVDQMNEVQLVAFLRRLADSPAFPILIDESQKIARVDGRLSGGSDYLVSQALQRLWSSFGYSSE